MSRTVAPPPNDPRLWRLALARLHPDAGGDQDLFVWGQAVRETVETGRCSGCPGRATRPERQEEAAPARVSFPAPVGHAKLTVRAALLGRETLGPLGDLLMRLAEYPQATSGRKHLAEQRGATYRQLKYLAVLLNIPARELYAVAERVPLSQAHCHYLITVLKEEGR